MYQPKRIDGSFSAGKASRWAAMRLGFVDSSSRLVIEGFGVTMTGPSPGHVGEAPNDGRPGDRKSTRLNSSHLVISYAVFCLKKKKIIKTPTSLLPLLLYCTE